MVNEYFIALHQTWSSKHYFGQTFDVPETVKKTLTYKQNPCGRVALSVDNVNYTSLAIMTNMCRVARLYCSM